MALHFIIMTLKFILYKHHWGSLVVSTKAQVHVVKQKWLNNITTYIADSENE